MNCFFVSANRTIAPSSAISRRCRRNAHNRIVSTQCSGCFTVVREITYVTQHARCGETDLRNRRPFWDTSFLFLNTPVRPEGLISCVRSTRHARPCRFLSVSSYLLSPDPGVRERERESAQNRTCEWIYCEWSLTRTRILGPRLAGLGLFVPTSRHWLTDRTGTSVRQSMRRRRPLSSLTTTTTSPLEIASTSAPPPPASFQRTKKPAAARARQSSPENRIQS